MRARLTYLVLSPTTPAVVAHGITRLLVLLVAILGLVATSTGAASHVFFGAFLGIIEAMDTVKTAVTA
jgi:hypothetical protein